MINELFGSHGGDVLQAAIGKQIVSLALGEDDALHFVFQDGTKIKLWDDGQSCCELRYMTTDDDLSKFIAAPLLDIEVADGPTTPDKYGEPHETQFLKITTGLGVFTMVTHNEHSGYYGGFYIKVEAE